MKSLDSFKNGEFENALSELVFLSAASINKIENGKKE